MVEMDFSPVRHKIEVYAQECQVLTTHIAAAPLSQGFILPLGIVRNVKVVFPRGCNRHISLKIMHHGVQWLPVNAGSVFEEDSNGQPLEFAVYRDVWQGLDDFQIIAWNDGIEVYWNHTITVYFNCEFSEVL